jgi:hypothetical protein
MTPWLEAVHAAGLIEKRPFTASSAVARFGAPPLSAAPASKQLRDAHTLGFFARGAKEHGDGEFEYHAISRAITSRRAPTAEEFLTHIGRVRSIFDLGDVLTHRSGVA